MIFCFSSICEVDTTADVTEKSAVGSVSRYAVMKYPSIKSVFTHEPIFQCKVLPRFERGKVLGHATLAIFGMDRENPILFYLFFERKPSKVQPWLVEECAIPVSV